MFDTLRSILAFAVDIGVLIFFHELGHYFAARSQGVTVEVFSIGFGPALLKRKAKSGTVWQISALPLGGYVKMQGWGEDEDGAVPAPGSFAGATLGSKAVIVAAGPLANLLLAVVLYAGLFMTFGQAVTEPVFATIDANSAAAAAHLQTGDRVLAIGGAPIHDFGDLQEIVTAHPDTVLDFTIRRAGSEFTAPVRVGHASEGSETVGRLGVRASATFHRLAPLPAIGAAFRQTGTVISDWGTQMGQLIVEHKGFSELSGPIGIAQVTGQVAALGVASLASLVAFLSVNLGLVNLIPIPMLDGGHLLFYAVEAVFRRKLPAQARELSLRIGVAFIATLVLVTTFNDLARLGAVAWLTHLL